MNQGSFAGRVGRDAQLRETPSGKKVLTFSVGVDTWPGTGEKKTLWVNCSLWGDRAEKLAPILVKGTPVAVSGEIEVRQWEKGGKAGVSLDLKCSKSPTLLGRVDRPSSDQTTTPLRLPPKSTGAAASAVDPDFNDDIPF